MKRSLLFALVLVNILLWSRVGHAATREIQVDPAGKLYRTGTPDFQPVKVGRQFMVQFDFDPKSERWEMIRDPIISDRVALIAEGYIVCMVDEPGCKMTKVFHLEARQPGSVLIQFALYDKAGNEVAVRVAKVRIVK
jgi:hypothetical protein